jgi:hypothetical protein
MRNCSLFRRNTKGATSGEGTANCSQLTRQVLPEEEKLPLLRSNTKVLPVEKKLPTLQKKHDGCY